MQRIMLKSKIHRARVTAADINYMGSISIDETLLKAADILPNEQVAIYNVSNGQRFETYAVVEKANSGVIQINGAAARLAQAGDIIIIATYALVDDREAANLKPKVVMVDEQNQIL